LAAWLVARGFAVLVPERPGHGASGGRYLEDQGGCDEADYAKAGHVTADSIAAVPDFMRGQSFVRQDDAVIVGHSAGAWGAQALAERNPQGVSTIVAFAPGRGGHSNDLPNQVCAPHTLISAAAEFGKGARVPVTWLVSATTAISRRLCRGKWPAPFAPAAEARIFACSRPPAAKATGWWRRNAASKVRRRNWNRALKARTQPRRKSDDEAVAGR
jgi:pimeloyl-ACP methyl ester carboxylesterase